MVQDICGQSHEERGNDGAEELVDLRSPEETVSRTAHQTAHAGAKAIGKGAAIEPAKAGGAQKVADILKQWRIIGPVFIGFPQPVKGGLGIGFFTADPAAQAGIALHSV